MNATIRNLLTVALCTLLGTPGVAVAGQLGHYQSGLLNIRDFFVPEPGFYAALYTFNYSTDTLKDRNGDEVGTLTRTGPLGTTTVTVDPDIDVTALAPTLIWVSPWKFLNARYAAIVAPSFADGSVDASLSVARSGRFGFATGTFDTSLSADTGMGVGDLFVQPAWLGWSGKHYDASASYGFYAPTGEKDIGLEFWTNQLQAAGAWYPFDNRGTAVTVAGTYEIQSEKEDEDLTPGDRFTLNWGISQYLPLNKAQTFLFEIGVTGYCQWQVNVDSGSDVPTLRNTQLNAQDHVYAAGVQAGLTQAGLTSVPWKAALTVRYLTEFGAEARFEGDYLGVTLAKGF